MIDWWYVLCRFCHQKSDDHWLVHFTSFIVSSFFSPNESIANRNLVIQYLNEIEFEGKDYYLSQSVRNAHANLIWAIAACLQFQFPVKVGATGTAKGLYCTIFIYAFKRWKLSVVTTMLHCFTLNSLKTLECGEKHHNPWYKALIQHSTDIDVSFFISWHFWMAGFISTRYK